MKQLRSLAVLLALVLLLGMIPEGLAAMSSTDTFCSSGRSGTNTHSWSSWTVTKAANCAHTGTRTRTCSYCQYTQTQTISKTNDHDWGSWHTTREATCTESGARKRTCSICGKTQKETIEKTGHNWGRWTTTKEATCTETGTRQRKCSVCGEKQTDTIDKKPHSYGEWTVTEEPTDHSAGSRTHTCTVCGHIESENFDPEGTLRRGDRGDAVKELQEGLICYGAMSGRADGEYGRGTENAVRAVQEAEGFEPDGVAWPQTQAVLGHVFGEWEVLSELTNHSKGERRRVCARCGYQETEEEWPSPVYQRGDSGDGVRALQEGLICYGALKGRADGSFGSATEKAVKAVQEAEGFAVDGIAWPQTQAVLGHVFGPWEVLSELSDFSKGERQRVCERCGTRETEEEWPSPMYKRGDTGEGVRALQEALNDAGYKCGYADGVFGSGTEKAVAALEADNGIEADGIAWPGVLKLLGVVQDASISLRSNPPKGTGDKPDGDVDPIDLPAHPEGPGLSIYAKADTYKKNVRVGQMLMFHFRTMNTGTVTLYDEQTFVYDNRGKQLHLYGSDEHPVDEYRTGDFPYTFNEDDLADGTVTFRFESKARTEGGETVPAEPFELTFHVFGKDDELPEEPDLVMNLTQTVTGGEDQGFYEGDEIEFVIAFENASIYDMPIASLRDYLNDDSKGVYLQESLYLPAHETHTESFKHTVDSDDVERGYVRNRARAWNGYGSGPADFKYSNPVKVTVAKDAPVSDPPAKPEPEANPAVTVVKTASAPKDPKGFVEGEKITYTIAVTNNTDEALSEVEVYDPLKGSNEDMMVDIILEIAPHKTEKVSFEYEVKPSDMGKKIVNTASAVWYVGDEKKEQSSNTVTVDTWTPEQKPLSIVKTVKGDVYPGLKENDVITFSVTVTNNGEIGLDNVSIADFPGDPAKGPVPGYDVAEKLVLDPHKSATVEVPYTIKAADVEQGYVYNRARAWDGLGAGSDHYIYSEPIKVYLNGKVEDPNFCPLAVEKTVKGGDGQKFGLNDEIIFLVRVTNNGETYLNNVSIADFSGDPAKGPVPGHDVAEKLAIDPHKSITVEVPYTVTDADAEQGYVYNRARAWDGLGSGSQHYIYSAPAIVYLEGATAPETEQPVTVVKTASAPNVPGGFVEGEKITYTIAITNNGDETLKEVEVYDPLKGSNEDMMVDIIMEIAPHGTEKVSFEYEVKPSDIGGKIVNTASAVWYEGDEKHEQPSNTVTVDTWKPVEEEQTGKVTLVKSVTNMPSKGYYIENETIKFEVKIHNGTDAPIHYVMVEDPLSTDAGAIIGTFEEIPAGESRTATLEYTVTAADIGHPVLNVAYAEFQYADGQPDKVMSNHVRVPTGTEKGENPFGVITEATVLKEEASKPANKKYYTRGETITYTITVRNTGETPIGEVIVYDTLAGGSGEIASIENFYPDSERVYSFSYKVGKDDVKKGSVINRAWIAWEVEGWPSEVWSDPVESPTGEEKPREPKPSTKPAPQPDLCIRTLTGLGEGTAVYTQEYCSEHKALVDEMNRAIAEADTEEAKAQAWTQAVETWTQALNAEYAERLEKATAEEKRLILEEKALFYAQLACRADTLALAEAESGEPAAKWVAEQLMLKTAELCYEAHRAPGERADSVWHSHRTLEPAEASEECRRTETPIKKGTEYAEALCAEHAGVEKLIRALDREKENSADAWETATALWKVMLEAEMNQKYLSADESGREAITAERIAYGKWLDAWQRLLELTYPGRPEIVNEVLAATVRARVLEICPEAE